MKTKNISLNYWEGRFEKLTQKKREEEAKARVKLTWEEFIYRMVLK
jgi:hypothetical protein